MKIRRNFMVYQIAQANVWYRAFNADDNCVGSMIQSQEAAANIWVCNKYPSVTKQAQQFFPGAEQYDDILPWQDELWVMSDTAGATLTFARLFKDET